MDEEPSQRKKRLKILVVDDEPRIRDVMLKLLVTEGFETATADSGDAALETIPEFQPHLVFLDIRMPDMDGIQCLRRIKESGSDAEVIMISGFATMDMARRCLEIGAFDYIGKPLTFDHIRDVIRQITITRFGEFI
ncbi:MAG: response regulator [Candidatus Latescibacterota bacterium]